jgi:hypothetical protein
MYILQHSIHSGEGCVLLDMKQCMCDVTDYTSKR